MVAQTTLHMAPGAPSVRDECAMWMNGTELPSGGHTKSANDGGFFCRAARSRVYETPSKASEGLKVYMSTGIKSYNGFEHYFFDKCLG